MTVRPSDRLTARLSAPQAHQYKITQSTGMAIQMRLKVLFGRKEQQGGVFFDVIFDVYTHVNNRESARANDRKQRRRISLEEKHENFIAAVRK